MLKIKKNWKGTYIHHNCLFEKKLTLKIPNKHHISSCFFFFSYSFMFYWNVSLLWYTKEKNQFYFLTLSLHIHICRKVHSCWVTDNEILRGFPTLLLYMKNLCLFHLFPRATLWTSRSATVVVWQESDEYMGCGSLAGRSLHFLPFYSDLMWGQARKKA